MQILEGRKARGKVSLVFLKRWRSIYKKYSCESLLDPLHETLLYNC